jgi:GT2 family glycosyltransferase
MEEKHPPLHWAETANGDNGPTKVSISILTYNRKDILKELLDSLARLRYEPLEIIVIDNNSTDGTEMSIANYEKVRYVKLHDNIGVGARNEGIRISTGDILICLDDDVIGIDDEKIKKIVSKFESKPDIGALCFKVVDFYNGKICNWSHHYKKEEYCDKEFNTDEMTEGAVAFRKSVFEKSGLYPEEFFISYEGPDLILRMLNAGFVTMYSPEIEVRHRTSAEGRKSWRRYYYDTRNQLWFVARNYPFWKGMKYLLRGLSAMLFYSLRDGYLTYWLKGIWDGLRALPSVMKERKPYSAGTGKVLSEIASYRPSIIYMIKQRVFKREIRL